MVIRPMEPGDAAQVCALCEQLGYPVAAESLQASLARVALLSDHLACVAVERQEVTGFFHASRMLGLFEPAWVEVKGLVVSEERRGLGIGAALLRAAEAWARTNRVGEVRLGCRITRTAAHGFYEQMGYRISKTQHRFVRVL